MSDKVRIPAYCAQCRSRCGCVATVHEGRLLGIEPLPGHPSGDKLCPKGRASTELVYHRDRLVTPLRRTTAKGSPDPGWQPISWDEALDTVAAQMARIANDYGAEQTAFSITTPSGTHISDSIHWIERFARAYGSANTVYGTEICNWHKDFASRFTFGYDIGVPDFEHTDCIMLWGNNPAATWLARAVEVNAARRRGARLLVVDPRPTVFARRADVWLPVTPGTDQVLALGLAHIMVKRAQYDVQFVREFSNGALLVRDDNGRFLRASDVDPSADDALMLAVDDAGKPVRYDPREARWLDRRTPRLQAQASLPGADGPVSCTTAFARYVQQLEAFTPQHVSRVTGVDVAALEAAASLLSESGRVAYYAWNGVGQSVTATQTDRALSLLYTLTGSYGRAGGNVPGQAAAFNDISGQELLSDEQRARTLGRAQRPIGPPSQGWITARDMYRAVIDGDPYRVRMLMSFGTNLLTSQPDTDLAETALKTLEFHVHADFFVNAAARYADIVLPVATSWEREGLRPGFDANLRGQRRVQLRRAVIAPVGEARSDIDIVLGLSQRLGLGRAMFDLDVDRGHDALLAGSGLTVARLREVPEGIDVDTEVVLEPYAKINDQGTRCGFPTPTKLIEIYSETLLDHGQAPIPNGDEAQLLKPQEEFPLRLGCAKTLYYCHGQHRNLPSLRRLEPDPPLEMSAQDASARGIEQGDWVRIITRSGHAVARARIVRGLNPGQVFAQHGWWEPGGDDTPYSRAEALAANVNRLIDTTQCDPISGSVALRASACEVERLDVTPEAAKQALR